MCLITNKGHQMNESSSYQWMNEMNVFPAKNEQNVSSNIGHYITMQTMKYRQWITMLVNAHTHTLLTQPARQPHFYCIFIAITYLYATLHIAFSHTSCTIFSLYCFLDYFSQPKIIAIITLRLFLRHYWLIILLHYWWWDSFSQRPHSTCYCELSQPLERASVTNTFIYRIDTY